MSNTDPIRCEWEIMGTNGSTCKTVPIPTGNTQDIYLQCWPSESGPKQTSGTVQPKSKRNNNDYQHILKLSMGAVFYGRGEVNSKDSQQICFNEWNAQLTCVCMPKSFTSKGSRHTISSGADEWRHYLIMSVRSYPFNTAKRSPSKSIIELLNSPPSFPMRTCWIIRLMIATGLQV